jgi:Tol biopolymer transport system component
MRAGTGNNERGLSWRVAVPVLAGLALLMALVMSAATAAAPIYTDWSAPVWLGSVVNSAASEAGPALSADGLSLYFYSNRPGSAGNDIWVSQRPTVSAAWGAPVNLGPTINTASSEFVPSLSSDGHWMYFASDRPGGFGLADLYESYRTDIHDDFGWQAPTNLGSGVNTAATENGNGFFDNGGNPQIYFGSDRLGPPMNSLFYLSNRQADGTWGPAIAVPELGAGNRPNLRQDGLEIFFYSSRAGGVGGIDLWTATRATVDAAWSTPVNLGSTVNSTFNDQHPSLSADATTLIFFSNRPGGSGGNDLWMTTRAQIFPTTKDECKNGGFERFGIFKNQGDCVSYVATGGTNSPG